MKIAILGDSISEGIGSKKVNYAEVINSKLDNCIIKNYAVTGTTISYVHEIKREIIDFNPDYIIVFYGNVDAMPRVNIKSKINLYNLLPNRYKRNGMLNPRALYTKKKPKRYFQIIDSIFRTNINKILIKIQGYYQWVNIEDFRLKYENFIQEFSETKLILISTVTIDERWFPFCDQEYKKYNKVINTLAKKYNCEFIDIYNIFSNYSYKEVYLSDNFHPNKNGYNIIANEIITKLKAIESKE